MFAKKTIRNSLTKQKGLIPQKKAHLVSEPEQEMLVAIFPRSVTSSLTKLHSQEQATRQGVNYRPSLISSRAFFMSLMSPRTSVILKVL